MNAADIRTELQDEMFDKAFVVRNEDGLKQMEAVLADLHDRYAQVGVQDKGSVYNTDLMEAVELGFLLDCAESLVAAARARDREPRCALPRRPPAARRRQLAQALAGVPSGRPARSTWSTSR